MPAPRWLGFQQAITSGGEPIDSRPKSALVVSRLM
jgi:hypothetical protein